MAYIDYDYYTVVFGGSVIEKDEFGRLSEIASDVIDEVAVVSFDINDLDQQKLELVKKATAYEVEVLYSQGGVDASLGLSIQSINSESLGDYSVSRGSTAQSSAKIGQMPSVLGVPVSPLAVSSLRKSGLMARWAFSGFYEDEQKPPFVRG